MNEPYVLVTTGGGGDGAALIDHVLRAYEQDPNIPLPALMVLGPFMNASSRAEYMARAARLNNVHAITFDANVEALFANAAAVIGMGGYNTFCEVLSFDKPALLAPRRVPRMEQFIRAERAQALGLSDMILDEGLRDAQSMAAAIRRLQTRPPPSSVVLPGLLDGLSVINGLADRLFDARPAAARAAARRPRVLRTAS